MQYYAEQLILFSKSSTSTTPLSSLQLPPNGHLNHHPIPNPNPTQPSQPHAAITAPLSSTNGSNSSIPPGFKKQPQETGQSVSDQPLVILSNFTPPINTSSFPGAPKRPFDALGSVPAPVLPNIVNQSTTYHSQTHVPVPVYSHLPSNIPVHQSSSSLTSYPSYLDPHALSHYRSQPQLHSQSHQQQQGLNQRQHHNQQVASSPSIPSSSSSTGHMDDPDLDTDTEDTDTSTDAGTETDGGGSETDEEPTIRAPPTVAGSVGSGSVWGDETDEADERMASP